MKFNKKSVTLHGERIIHIVSPEFVGDYITASDNGTGYQYIMTNGTGYGFLAEIFRLSTTLKKNEIFYIPFNFKYIKEYEEFFCSSRKHYSGFVAFNYCTAQLNLKDIRRAINTKTCKCSEIYLSDDTKTDYVDWWKTDRRLTVKQDGSLFSIATNADGFKALANSCENLADYGDDIEYNQYAPHMHHDWNENTSKSEGITFYFWQHP